MEVRRNKNPVKGEHSRLEIFTITAQNVDSAGANFLQVVSTSPCHGRKLSRSCTEISAGSFGQGWFRAHGVSSTISWVKAERRIPLAPNSRATSDLRQDEKHITLPSSMTNGPKSPAKSTRSRVGVTSHRCTVAQVTKRPVGLMGLPGFRDSGMTFWAGFHMKHQGFYVFTK